MKSILKKSLALILALTLAFGAAPLAGLVGLELPSLKDVFADKAEAATYGALTYEVSYGKVTITDCDTSASGELVIPSSIEGYPVTSIGNSAFSYCAGLTSITIPDSVTSIGKHAFYRCTRLTSITIPDSVTSIGNEAFRFCKKLKTITVDGSNLYYSSDENGALFNKDKTELIQYPVGKTASEYKIPDSVTSIGDYVFEECTSLTSVTIPDSVTSIGDCAFQNCNRLTSVTIGSGVTSIGDYAFLYCRGLTSVTIPDSVTSIGKSAFDGCTGLTSVTIPDSVTSIGDGVFEDCTSLTSVTIPNSVTSIGGRAFSGCSGLTNITIPDSVTSIGDYAFSLCTGLTSITIPDSVTSIGFKTFLICSSLTSVTIPNSVTRIGGYAFSGCTGLTSITIPDSVTSIGNYVFEECTSLTSVTIPNSITSIGEGAFSGCSGLTNITIPDSVTSIGGGAFFNTGIYNNSSNWEDNVLYLENHLINTQSDYLSGSYSIKEGTKTIADYAFYSCDGLTSVTIPDSVTRIGDYAFYSCDGLTSVTIPNSVTFIGDCAFYLCYSLTSVTIPDSVTSIGDQAFRFCHGLASVTIPDSVTSIGEYAFYYCTGLTSITIPDSVTSIGNSAFSGCTSLTSVTIPNSVTSIGKNAFYDTGIYNNSSNWENNTLYIGNHLIKAESELSGSYSTKEGTKTIADYAFEDCTYLTRIAIPDSVTSIGEYAFYDCDSLTDVYYRGSESEWNEIAICLYNTPLTDANIHFNYCSFIDMSIDFSSYEFNNGYLSINEGTRLSLKINGKYNLCPDACVERSSDDSPYWVSYEIFYENGEPTYLSGAISISGMNTEPIVSGKEYNFIMNIATDKLASGKYNLIINYPYISCDVHDEINTISDFFNVEIVEHDCSSLDFNVDCSSYELNNGYLSINEGTRLSLGVSGKYNLCPYACVERSSDDSPYWASYEIFYENGEPTYLSGVISISGMNTEPIVSGKEYNFIMNIATDKLASGKYDVTINYPYIRCDVHDAIYTESVSLKVEIVEHDCSSLDFNVDCSSNELNNGYLCINEGTRLSLGVSGKYNLCPYACVERSSDDSPYWASYEIFYENGEPTYLSGAISISGMNTEPIVSGKEYEFIMDIATDKLASGKYDVTINYPYIRCDVHDAIYTESVSLKVEIVEHNCSSFDLDSDYSAYEFNNGYLLLPEGCNLVNNMKMVFDLCPYGYVESNSDGSVCLSYLIKPINGTENIVSGFYTINGLNSEEIVSGKEYDITFSINTDKLEPGEYEVIFSYPEVGCDVHEGYQSSESSLKIRIVENYTLIFDTNGGSGAPSAQSGNGNIKLSSTIPTRSGYTFLGWATSASATSVQYLPGASFNLTQDETLFAIWKKNETHETPTENSVEVSINNSSANTTIYYRESLTLYATASNLPEGGKIKWRIVEGTGVAIEPSRSGNYCIITSESTGNVVIEAYAVNSQGTAILDESGNICSDREGIHSEANLWLRIVYFFKKIFGLTKTFSEAFNNIF